MNAIIIDDELYSIRYLERLCFHIPELTVLECFDNAASALEYLKKTKVDLIFSDINMPGMSGLDAVPRIRQLCPDAGIIFVTGYGQYALKAFQLEAVSYLMKPCTAEDLANAVKRAGRLQPAKSKRVEIVTFGYFKVLIGGVPLRFSNSKAEELLALLVDREGAAVTLEQAADVLWETRPFDEPVKRLYRKATGYLNQLFREQDVSFFVSDRGSCHVLPSEFDCDYYRLMRGDEEVRKHYCGEYMTQYSWAEYTNGKIESYLNGGWE